MNHHILLTIPVLLATAAAQSPAIFPSDYSNVAEGPLNAANIPLSSGTSRVMLLYDTADLTVPTGHQITSLGFRQDGTLTTMDAGRTLQLEIRMGYTDRTHTTMLTNFDNNYVSTPVTVFGPTTFVLPNLRDAANPLPNGRVTIPLTTLFTYSPAAGQNLLVEYRVFGTSGGGAAFNYRLDRADYYSPITYGPAGCPHSGGGTPSLTVQPTRPGLSYSCSMSTGPANSVGVLAINAGMHLAPAYPLAPVFQGINPACLGQMDPTNMVLLSGSSSASGAATWSFTIPNDEAFAKFPISSQALFLDFFAPGGLVVSRGAEVLTGMRPHCSSLTAAGAPTVVTTGSVSQFYCPVAFFGFN
ncbi:MAG: hypothetical protein JNN13_20010 [Planctomycetes bacterium]|nr:hypothetical protein [Planctomycetota bacterium]